MKKPENGDRWPRVVRAGSASTKVFRIKHHGTKSGVAYVVAWYANGQRKRQKFANQGEALHEARLRADQINSGQVEAAGFSKQDRDELVAARSITGNVPLLAALKEWRRGHNLTAGNIIPACEAWASRNSTAHDRRKVADVTKLYLAAKSKPASRPPTITAIFSRTSPETLATASLTRSPPGNSTPGLRDGRIPALG